MRVDAPVALVIKPEAVGAFPPLGLRFLLIRVVVLHEPCSSHRKGKQQGQPERGVEQRTEHGQLDDPEHRRRRARSDEHTSELQSLMRIHNAAFYLKKKNLYEQTSHAHTRYKHNKTL